MGRTKPDLVLMDVCMPKLDGLQTTRKLRNGGESARIVLLTAYGDTIPRWLAEEVGADDVLDKSNLGERLREAVVSGGRRLPQAEDRTRANGTRDGSGREMKQGERHEALSRVLTSLAGIPPSADDISDDRVAAIVATGL